MCALLLLKGHAVSFCQSDPLTPIQFQLAGETHTHTRQLLTPRITLCFLLISARTGAAIYSTHIHQVQQRNEGQCVCERERDEQRWKVL